MSSELMKCCLYNLFFYKQKTAYEMRISDGVQTCALPICALPDPTVGRIRTSSDGLVFWFNPGPEGFGYAVCLHCGRAEAETLPEGGTELEDHRPLRGQPLAEESICTGAPELAPFAVKRRLSLAQEIRPEACEGQFNACTSSHTATKKRTHLRAECS